LAIACSFESANALVQVAATARLAIKPVVKVAAGAPFHRRGGRAEAKDFCIEKPHKMTSKMGPKRTVPETCPGLEQALK
jgi:hypothetical protein